MYHFWRNTPQKARFGYVASYEHLADMPTRLENIVHLFTATDVSSDNGRAGELAQLKLLPGVGRCGRYVHRQEEFDDETGEQVFTALPGDMWYTLDDDWYAESEDDDDDRISDPDLSGH